MTQDTKTPRTNKVREESLKQRGRQDYAGRYLDMVAHADTLEQELAEANSLVKGLRESCVRYDAKVQDLERQLGYRT